MGPIRVEGRGGVTVVRISLWRLAGAGSGEESIRGGVVIYEGALPVAFHSPQDSFLLVSYEGRDDPRAVRRHAAQMLEMDLQKVIGQTYLMARAVTLPALEGRGPLVWGRAIR